MRLSVNSHINILCAYGHVLGIDRHGHVLGGLSIGSCFRCCDGDDRSTRFDDGEVTGAVYGHGVATLDCVAQPAVAGGAGIDLYARVAVGGGNVGCCDGLRVFTCIYCITHAGGGCADCHAGGVFSRLGGRTGELRTVLGICNCVGAGVGRGVVARA